MQVAVADMEITVTEKPEHVVGTPVTKCQIVTIRGSRAAVVVTNLSSVLGISRFTDDQNSAFASSEIRIQDVHAMVKVI